MPDRQAGDLVEAANRMLREQIGRARDILSAPAGPAPSAAVIEALAEGCATLAALGAASRASWDQVIGSAVRRRSAELVFEALCDLALAVPGWSWPDVGAIQDPDVATGSWTLRYGSRTWIDAVQAALASPTIPVDRPEDLTLAIAERAAAVEATLEVEWESEPEVFATALPLLARGVADALLLSAMAADSRCSDVAIRRFAYRRFSTRVAEGLTPRHLVRSRELIDEVLA